jgi:hypothetical protein
MKRQKNKFEEHFGCFFSQKSDAILTTGSGSQSALGMRIRIPYLSYMRIQFRTFKVIWWHSSYSAPAEKLMQYNVARKNLRKNFFNPFSMVPIDITEQTFQDFQAIKAIKASNSVVDLDPGSGAFFTLDPGWVKNQDPDPG